MAYSKTTWVDRNVEYPGRYDKSNETTTSVTLAADPGTITEAGTPSNATNMNKLETGVEAAASIADTAKTTADAALPKAGGTMTGTLVSDTSTGRQIALGSWGDVGSNANGNALFLNNAYTDASTNMFRYSRSHASLGARGIRLGVDNGIEYFDTGAVATTADAEFTPIWQPFQPSTFVHRDEITNLTSGDVTTYAFLTGQYSVGTTFTGMPTTSEFWTIQANVSNSSTADLIAFGRSSSSSIYYRNKTNGIWGSWLKVWNSGSDGTGSGLDADKLDGLESSASSAASTVVARDGAGDIYGANFNGTGFIMNSTAMAQTRDNAGVLEFYTSGAWKPVGGVESVQRGTVNFGETDEIINVTVSAVDTSKAYIPGINTKTTATSFTDASVRAELTSTTNIKFDRAGTSGAVVFGWQLVESY